MTIVTDTHEGNSAPGLAGRILRGVLWFTKFIVGVLFCLTPLTAVLVLGWLSRFMRRSIILKLDPSVKVSRPNWIFSETSSFLSNFTSISGSALWKNIKSGFAALSAITIISFPYCALWLLSWWAGWDNSFNKGYEQAFVGPMVAVSGIVFAFCAWTYLPFALAHQAAEERWLAFFEFRKIRQLIRMSGRGLILVALLYLILAGFIFLVRSIPVFMEHIYPAVLSYTPEQMKKFIDGYFFWMTFLLFAGLVILRSVTGRVYASAARRCVFYYQSEWKDTFAAQTLKQDVADPGKPWFLSSVLYFIVLILCWPAVVFLIYAGQFFNHDWYLWVQHPLFQLPWFIK